MGGVNLDIVAIANQLLLCEKTKQVIRPLTETYPNLSGNDAYKIQLAQMHMKVNEGAEVKGLKIGLTSKEMQQMLNVYTPDYGIILNSMVYEESEDIAVSSFIQPKIEFEIAFVFKEGLSGTDISVDDVIAAVDYVVPAVEIIDSRIENWEIKFEDTVADNGSSAGIILGSKRTPLSEIEDITNIEMQVMKNDEFLVSAKSDAVLGNPLNAVVWLVNEISKYGVNIEPGMFVLSGSLSKAFLFEEGDQFTADFGMLGTITTTFEKVGVK
jgi:2-keto-4-pentenoate hydratase